MANYLVIEESSDTTYTTEYSSEAEMLEGVKHCEVDSLEVYVVSEKIKLKKVVEIHRNK